MRKASKNVVLGSVFFFLVGAQASADTGFLPVYGLDYPHEIGPEYVYRTSRVFVPEEPDISWFTGFRKLFERRHEAEIKPAVPEEQATELKLKVRELSRQLLLHSREPVAEELRVIVSTFVNLNRLYMTSGLGRAIAEQMISEMQRGGVEVVDVRMTPSLQIREGHGEYSLSRDMSELSYVHDVQAVVSGTYTVSDGQVIVGARILQQGDGMVLSSGSITFPVNDFIRGLLQDEAMPPRKGAPVQLRSFSAIDPQK